MDLQGYDFRPYNFPDFYFHLDESAPSWGDQVHLNYAFKNAGTSPPAPQSFNIEFYISSDTTIETSDFLWQRFTGYSVPNAATGSAYTATLTLPASNPLDPLGAGPFTIGMIVDSQNTVAESNEANNRNQGTAKDQTAVSILPPVAVVSDSVGASMDHAIDFGSIVNDGAGNSNTIQTVTLSDSAAKSLLKVPQDGIQLLNGTSFEIVGILSNRLSQAVNVAGGTSLIAANSSETWTIQVAFDPVENGALADTLQIQTDDPANPTINVALSGTGTPLANLLVTDSVSPTNDQTANFGDVGVDGSGGAVGSASVTLSNNGSGTLSINQNGITLPAGPFAITGITSSTQGAIDLASGSKTIAADGTETWTVGLSFDPTIAGLFQLPLTVLSDDPDSPTAAVSLLGTGKTLSQLLVTDSVLPPGDLAVGFGSVHADGTGKKSATQSVVLSNAGQLPLQVDQNGISLLTGTQFNVSDITSSTQGAIDLSGGAKEIAADGAETWTVTIAFDPSVAGASADTLQIASNDVASPTLVALSGTGLDQPSLVVTESDTPNNDLVQAFDPTLNDGAGGRNSTQALQLTNVGTQPLVISQNGVSLLGGTDYQVVSVVSSINGAINLASGSAAIAPAGDETWTVTVAFDPLSTAVLSDTLRITSNDPLEPTVDVTLNGQGVIPAVSTAYPQQTIHVSAGNVYEVSWSGTYAPDTGTYSVFYDTDLDPSAGLVAIATALPQSKSSYDWHVPTALEGGTFTIYVTMQDGSVSAGSYGTGSLTVDPLGSDRLLSAPVTDQGEYTLSYVYNGTTYDASYALAMGDNALYATAAGTTHEYHVLRAATLVDTDSTEYDELGNVTVTTDSNGQSVTYQYDQLSRVTQVSYPDGTQVNYAYDAASNLVSMRDPTGWQLYGYDVRNRLTSVTYSPTNDFNDPAALTIGYEYDLASQLSALIYPSGKRVEYGYSTGGKLSTVTEKTAGQSDLVTSYTYDAATGQLATTTRPNDTQTVNAYDDNGRLVDILHRQTSTSALILQYHYSLDTSGRRTQVVVTTPEGVRAEAYVYDDLDRLTQVTYSDDNGTIDATDEVVKYTYDANGNRLTMATYANGEATGATETLTYVYGFENQLLSVTDQNGAHTKYSYDWRGNQVQKVTPTATTLYTYDTRNLLRTVNDGTNHVQYQYDGAGRRVGQKVNGVVTEFVIDPSSLVYQTIEERDPTGSVLAAYSYGAGRLSAEFVSVAGHSYYLADALNSVGQVTSSIGATIGSYSYDVFGKERTVSDGIVNPYRYGGERTDEAAGVLFLRHRSYDLTLGRFLQKDPLGMVDAPSQYIYAGNNPTTYADPSGLFFETPWDALNVGIGVVSLGANLANGNYLDAGLDAVGLAYDIFATAVPALPAGASTAIKSTRVAAAANDLVHSQRTLNKIRNAADRAHFPESLTGAVLRDGTTSAIKSGDGAIRTLTELPGQGGTFRIVVDPPSKSITHQMFETPSSSLHYDRLSPTRLPTGAGVGIGIFRGVTGQGSSNTPLEAGVWSDGVNKYDGFRPDGQLLNFGGHNPGGVLIDKAAILVGANINEISGATFDPVTHQLVFLGSEDPAALHDVNLDLFTTAIASVYGSAVPPYVTLDPPAKLLQQTFNVGDGDGVILNGKSVSVPISYTPFTPTEADDMTLSFKLNGQPVSIPLNGWVMDGQGGLTLSGGGRFGMGLTLENGTSQGDGQATAPSGVAGVTVGMSAFGVDVLKPQFNAGSITLQAGNAVNLGGFGGGGYTLIVDAQGQQSTWSFGITNNSGTAQTVTDLKLIPDLQHRKLGGRTDATRLGWIMEEADRVMKELGGGKSQLTGEIYDSSHPDLPAGFQNLLERYVGGNQSGSFNNRFWFTPNYQTLKRYVDPVTGEATVVFDESSVQLNTEALILGQPEDVTARAFADYFNAHYDELAAVSFPVHDPAFPYQPGDTPHIIHVKIFEELRDAMKAVAVARFFRDNNIPLDTWWINSWTPPTAFVPETIPTLTNSLTSGSVTVTFHGGVSIKTPNTYLPDAVAKSISDAVLAQRTQASGDLSVQSWTVDTGTAMGDLNAVAASLEQQRQDANVTLGASDLSFASPGGRQLTFDRYYNSGFVGDDVLGLGWQPLRYDLQFQFPTLVDDGGLMRDGNGDPLDVKGTEADTQLRAGEVRLVDQASGQLLNFFSSLTTAYSLDSQNNPILVTSGLTIDNVPTFTPGQYQDGSTLTQNPSTKNYTLTAPDGSTVTFDYEGSLLTTTNRLGATITYGYTNGKLSQITDNGGQKLTITHGGDDRIQYVAGPDNSAMPERRIEYKYDASGRLFQVDTQTLQGATYVTARSTTYQYNADNQISGVIGPDGVTTLTNTSDLRGRSDQRQDALGNMVHFAFAQDSNTGMRTTEIADMGTTGMNDPTAHGVDALKYFAAGSTSMREFDSTDRPTQNVDALGNATTYGYAGDSLLPTSISLPDPDRPAISIERNSANLPTLVDDPANTGGQPVAITYTAANLPDEVTDTMGLVTKYTYTAWNDIETVTVAHGTPLAATTTYNYNASKLLQSVVDPLGHTIVSYTYDSLDRIETVTDGDNVTTTYEYDSIGRLHRVYDPRLTGATDYVEYSYNDNDQVTQIATPTGNITYQYDPATLRLQSVTDLANNTTSYTYDPATGILTDVTQVASGGDADTEYIYDRRGSLAMLIAPEGTRTAFRYDTLGRATEVIEDDGTAPSGRITADVTSATTLTLQVDASEPILVASLTYWQDGQQQSSGVTVSQRPGDATELSFELTGLDTTKTYHYELELTDRVGLETTTGDAVLGTLTLDVAAFVESAGSVQATITRSDIGLTSDPLVVRLSGSDDSEFVVPIEVTIPAGQPSTTFNIQAVDDVFVDGDQLASLFASADSYIDQAVDVLVLDDDLATTSLISPTGASSDNTPTFAWNAVDNATSYELWVYHENTQTHQIVYETGITGTSFTAAAPLPAGSYRYWVRAAASGFVNSDWVEGNFAIGVTLTAPVLTAPTGNNTDTTPTFTWNAVNDAAAYELTVYSVTTNTHQVIYHDDLASTSFTPTVGEALPAGDYRFWVRAEDSGGTSGPWSAGLDFSIGSIPAVPSLIGPIGVTNDTTPTFTWQDVGADHYVLWVTESASGQRVIYETNVTTNSFTPSTSLNFGSHVFWVQAFSSAGQTNGWSGQGNFAVGSVPGVPILIGPTGDTSDTTPTFSWNAAAGAVTYELTVYNQSTGTHNVIHETALSTTSHTSVAALAGGQYQFWVRGRSASGLWGDWSLATYFSVGAPAIPVLLGPTGNISDTTPTFSWNATAGAARYEVWVYDYTTNTHQVIHDTNVIGTSYTSGIALTVGHTYRFWVRAFNADDLAGDWADFFEFTIL